MTREEAVLLVTNCTINSYDYDNLKFAVNKIYDDILQQLKTKDDEIAELQTKLQSLEVYCEEQKNTWESQENGNHKVYEKILIKLKDNQ